MLVTTSIDLSNYYTKGQTDTLLAAKQNTISDLATIRSGAQSGATAYQKPSGGIPSTDMSSAVQTSLGKADTALQPAAISAMVESTPVRQIVVVTQAQYDAIVTKEPNTEYNIIES